MFNSTSVEAELVKETPIVAIIFCSVAFMACICACKYIPKWSNNRSILPL